VNDVVRLQALIDKKKVIITEATVQEALRLDDAESIDYLPNEEIFTELERMGYEKPSTKLTFYKAFFSARWKFLIHTILQCMSAKRTSWDEFKSIDYLPNEEIFTELERMGYEKPSTKLTFYKAFFSARWKFLIHTILQCMSAKRTSWDEFSSFMASTIICLSTGRKFNFSKYIFDSRVRNVDGSSKFYMYPRFLQPMIKAQVSDVSSHTTKRVKNLKQDKIAQALEITKLKQRVRRLEKRNKDNVEETAELQEVIEKKERGSDKRPEETDALSIIIHTKPKSKDKGKGIMVQEPKPLKKKAQIEKDEAYVRELEAELNKNINWDDVIEQVQRKKKEENAMLRYQALKRKPQTEAQAKKNMIVYLKNMVGFKMDYFKGMRYDVILLIFEKYFNSNVAFLEKTKEKLEEEESRALKRTSESLKEKAAKKQKLDEEVEELKKHLQIVPNDDDDVYTEATRLALKIPIVDYEIYTENNKPYYKIIRADGSHQLFLSFLSLLRNFDREDLEILWKLICKATTARRIQTRVVFGYILHKDQAG
nr:hypothetical protein [Tanacetum cinerariifolium]